MKLTIILPTRNEASIIADSLVAISAALGPQLSSETEILIADDGTDELPSLVESFHPRFSSISVLRNSPPLGKGRALARAFELARGEICGFLDADLSTPPEYILEARTQLTSGEFDLVIGSRRAKGSRIQRKQHPLKTFLGNLLSFFSSNVLFVGRRRFHDTQCGFKFFRSEVAKSLYRGLLISDGMADIEILLRATERGYRVKELAVAWKDEREGRRPLRRTLLPDLKAVLTLLFYYRLSGQLPARREKTENA